MRKIGFLFSLKLIFVFVLLSVTLVAQNGKKPKSDGRSDERKAETNISALDSRRWTLVEINGKKIENAAPFIELDHSRKRFVGYLGYNGMHGKVETDGNIIKFSGITRTRRFWRDRGVMKYERDFLRALKQTTRCEQKGQILNFYARGKLILKFETILNDSLGMGLDKKNWFLTAIRGKPVPEFKTVTDVKRTMPYVKFNKEKKGVGGYTGCNGFGGNYETEGEKISMTKILSTLIGCNEYKIELEFLDGLHKASRYKIENGKLYFYEDKKLLLTFDEQGKK